MSEDRVFWPGRLALAACSQWPWGLESRTRLGVHRAAVQYGKEIGTM